MRCRLSSYRWGINERQAGSVYCSGVKEPPDHPGGIALI